MRLAQEGSSLLTITLLITLISLVCIQMWRTTALAFETTLTKQTFEQNFFLTEALLSWAIDLCKNNFDTIDNYIILHPTGLQLTIKNWNIIPKATILELHFKHKKKEKKQLFLESRLQTKDSGMTISCYLTRKYNEKKKYFYYKVSKWALNNT